MEKGNKEQKKGRQKKVPNLKKSGGNLINQHNVEFTVAEKKHLESLVNSANRKRKRMKEKEENLFRIVGGKVTTQKISEVRTLGDESDFILQPKSKSLQRFKTRDDFERYIRNLERVTKRDYIPMRQKIYKENHLKAIENTFGKDNEVYQTIANMPMNQYLQTVASDIDFLEIQYIYSEEDIEIKLEAMRESLGLIKE